MVDVIQSLKDWWYGIPLGGAKRSPQWRSARKQNILGQCEFCGIRRTALKPLELHHILPVNVAPSEELNPQNFFTACRDCHFKFCHLQSFFSYNLNIRKDAEEYKNKVANRP